MSIYRAIQNKVIKSFFFYVSLYNQGNTRFSAVINEKLTLLIELLYLLWYKKIFQYFMTSINLSLEAVYPNKLMKNPLKGNRMYYIYSLS